MSDGFAFIWAVVLSVAFIVIGATSWAYETGKHSSLERVITSCKESGVYINEGLLLQCALVHQAK